ncbi:MAG: thioredoxin domain-containing protein [Candidatus Diapherotrites archaeon]|nr:thioredoxin domain-containing protein [Candidatus Diapherotrites archaeon]
MAPERKPLPEEKIEKKLKARKLHGLPIGILAFGFVAAFFVGIVLGSLVISNAGLFTAKQQLPSTIPAETEGKSMQEVAQSVVDYINTNLLANQNVTAELKSVEEQYGLYAITITLKASNGQTQDAVIYAPKEGSVFLIGNLFDLSKPLWKQEFKKTVRPEVKLFVMSFCPYGKQTMKAMMPVVKLLSNAIDFEPHYVIYSSDYYRGAEEQYCISDYCSMHGIDELREDIRQKIIWLNFKDKFWDYVAYVIDNCSLDNIESCWKDAAKNANINPEEIEALFAKDANTILKDEKELDDALNVSASPTLFINGTVYNGSRDSNSLKNAICSAFTTQPEECKQELSSSEKAAQGYC